MDKYQNGVYVGTVSDGVDIGERVMLGHYVQGWELTYGWVHECSYLGVDFLGLVHKPAMLEPRAVYLAVRDRYNLTEEEKLLTLQVSNIVLPPESRSTYRVLGEGFTSKVEGSNNTHYKTVGDTTIYKLSEVFGTYHSSLYVTASDGLYTIHSGCYKSNNYSEWLLRLEHRMECSPSEFINLPMTTILQDLECVIAHIEGSGL